MAKYLAGGRVRGTLHGVTYQRNMYTGWVAKEKSSITAEQIATSPAFQRTRENNNEMKGVGLAVKALRGSLSQFLPFVTDPIVTGRMIRVVKEAQLKSAGIRGQRTIGYQALCDAMRGFQVSNVYRTESALRNLNVTIATPATPASSLSITVNCDNIVWPAGANCGVPFVTTIEVDDVVYDAVTGIWDFSHITWQDRISQSVLLDKSILTFQPETEIELSYSNGRVTANVGAGEANTNFNFLETLPKNSDEFGRVLVWFGVQFGQLISVPVPEGDTPRMEFYPMRGATAGLVVGDLAPNPAG